MISLTNYDFQWARSELVIIYPDSYYGYGSKWWYQWAKTTIIGSGNPGNPEMGQYARGHLYGKSMNIQCGAPKIAKLVYNSNNYGL